MTKTYLDITLLYISNTFKYYVLLVHLKIHATQTKRNFASKVGQSMFCLIILKDQISDCNTKRKRSQ